MALSSCWWSRATSREVPRILGRARLAGPEPAEPPTVMARRPAHLVRMPPLGPVVELLRQSRREPVLLWQVGDPPLVVEQDVLAERPRPPLQENERHLSLHAPSVPEADPLSGIVAD